MAAEDSDTGIKIYLREIGQIPFSVKARAREGPFRSDSPPPSHACHPERTRGTSPKRVDHTRLFGAQWPARGVPRRLRVSG